MAQLTTQQAVSAPTRWYVTLLPVDSCSRLDAGVIVLKRPNGQRLLAHRLVPHVEATFEFVDPFLRSLVRRMRGARRVIQEEWLVRREHLGIFDELQRLIGQIFSEVVALGRGLRLIDRVVVVRQLGIPLARLGAEETVEALEPATGRPVAPRRGPG